MSAKANRVWNAEADAKLFCAVLAQIKDTSFRLDYEAMANYMGPGWTSGALKNRIQRLRATARAEETSTPIPKAKSASPPASTPDPATPSKKRKRNPTPRTPRATKGKKEDTAQSIEEESENMKELAEALTKCETEKRNDDDSSIDI